MALPQVGVLVGEDCGKLSAVQYFQGSRADDDLRVQHAGQAVGRRCGMVEHPRPGNLRVVAGDQGEKCPMAAAGPHDLDEGDRQPPEEHGGQADRGDDCCHAGCSEVPLSQNPQLEAVRGSILGEGGQTEKNSLPVGGEAER